ncbi:hypothetical protein BDR03DRAFT_977769 [Suillus americanus]|nr:hypothetical protein BDR03DRAFT_977769 [Suillus americanus]
MVYPSQSILHIHLIRVLDQSIATLPRLRAPPAVNDLKAHTNYKYLGLVHMQDIAKIYAAQVKELKLQACNNSQKHMTSLTQLDDYNCLLMAISENDVPHLQQVIKITLDNGASVREVVNKLEDAIEGCQLLYALNHQISIPSIRTLRARSTFTTIMPTIGPIRPEQFDENIRNIILNTRDGTTSLCGVSFMINKLALEEMAIHFGKYNMIGGLCWKHSNLVDPVLRTYDSAVQIAQKIHTQEVHLGKEVTVIGMACFSEDELYPVLVALTCKTENAADMEVILTRAIKHWGATGADTCVGPVWSFATDGDATCHAAGHRLFVKKPLSSDSLLYATLSDMPRLNTLTGDNEVTLDLDFKHIFKCICTLIRSPAGITLNNGCIINTMMLLRYLIWLPAQDEASVTKLLHPDDPQDVPHAIKLMQAIVTFSKSQQASIDNSFSTDIDLRADLMSIKLLSDIMESILLLFININLSLTEQVQYLSRYAHLSFAIFRSHRRAFMPYQLYYNTHTMVKNLVFCIWKQQILDPGEKFFVGDSGDDHLELHFGRTQMIGGHNSGCSYSQVLDRLGAAKDIDSVFKRHPDLDPGHRHLKPSVPPNPVAPQILDVPSLPLPYPDITHMDVNDESAELTFEEALIAQADADIPSTRLHQVQPDPSAPPLPGGPGRVRAGYTKVNKRIDMLVGCITDGNLFLVGNIFLMLIHSGRTISLGILHSTSLILNNISRSSINVTIMKAARTTVKITGQLLTIIATNHSSDSLPTLLQFLWNRGYVKSHSVIQGTSDFTECAVVVSIPSLLVEPINPELTFIRLRNDINSDDFVEIKGGQSMWQVSQGALEAACGLLWEKSLETSVPLKSMVSVTPSDTKTFPYQLADGTLAIPCVEGTNLLIASDGERITTCCLCAAKVTDMRAHVGLHILCALTNTPEEVNMVELNKPSRNIPLKCKLCNPTLPPEPGRTFRRALLAAVDAVWRYNMPEHILKEHEEYAIPGYKMMGVPLPAYGRTYTSGMQAAHL